MSLRTAALASLLLLPLALVGCGECRNLGDRECTAKGRDYLYSKKEAAKGRAALTTACEERGYLPACGLLGMSYAADPARAGVARDDARALPLLKRACEAGARDEDNVVGQSCYTLGLMHAYMRGVPYDVPAERMWMRRACATFDYRPACHFEAGIGVVVDSPEGLGRDANGALLEVLPAPGRLNAMAKEYDAKCQAGDADACHRLAWMANRGAGVTWDAKRARELQAKACGLGNMRACNDAGVMTLFGAGGPSDEPAGLALLEKARDGGFTEASWNLALVKMRKRGSFEKYFE